MGLLSRIRDKALATVGEMETIRVVCAGHMRLCHIGVGGQDVGALDEYMPVDAWWIPLGDARRLATAMQMYVVYVFVNTTEDRRTAMLAEYEQLPILTARHQWIDRSIRDSEREMWMIKEREGWEQGMDRTRLRHLAAWAKQIKRNPLLLQGYGTIE